MFQTAICVGLVIVGVVCVVASYIFDYYDKNR